MKLALLDELTAARAAKQPVALATWLDGSDQRIVTAATAPAALADAVTEALRLDQAQVVDGVLVEPHNPPPRLVIVGAVHVAESLAKLGALAGFAVTIVDPRRAWATSARFPGQALVLEWPDVGVRQLALDTRSAVVTLTHDPKLDDPAIVAALETPAFYIGCLGSKKTHAARLERLAGCAGLERLHGPVGLKIGARAPAEIAVSIFAEIIAVLRGAAA
ncbi:MAG TPA: XdhC family protein [Kofleriaceae bacterium]